MAARPARAPGPARRRAHPRRLLPPPRQAAEAVPHDAAAPRCRSATARSRRTPSARTCTTTCSPRSPGRAPDPLRDLHLEGRRGRRGVQAGAQRGGRRGAWRSTRSTTGSPTWSSPRCSSGSARGCGCCEYPVYNAGWRFFDLRRYGRDHRKILVVDDEVAFVGGYNIGSAYATEWRDTHVRITGPGCGTSSGPSRTSGTSTASPGTTAGRCCWRPSRTGSPGSGCTATCRGSGCSRSGRCTSRRSTAPRSTSG